MNNSLIGHDEEHRRALCGRANYLDVKESVRYWNSRDYIKKLEAKKAKLGKTLTEAKTINVGYRSNDAFEYLQDIIIARGFGRARVEGKRCVLVDIL